MLVGIIGNGFVGKATRQLECDNIKTLIYDINPDLCVPKNLSLDEMNQCEIIFVSVPTPMNKDGSCYLNIVRTVLENLKNVNYGGFIVIRSTVPVGTCDELNCYFMPEFLTEKNFINDFINNKNWIFGLLGQDLERDELFKEKITSLFTKAYHEDRIAYRNITFLTNKEAEMVKMFRNCYLSAKISFCNEVYDFCGLKGMDYDKVRNVACDDDRIMLSHTAVPGHDGKRGFGGTCFPKDTSSLRYEMRKAGMVPHVLNAVIERNETIDRVEKDWNDNLGRAVVSDN
jgi:nucleotide sugar dehydrogenase